PEQDWSLFARLFDAWRAVFHFADMPVLIDASLTGPLTEPPEDLRGLMGHQLAHARIANQCGGGFGGRHRVLSHHRAMQVIGDRGVLELSDRAYRLIDKEGRVVDESASSAEADDATFAGLIASQWKRLIDRGPSDPTPIETEAQILACCLACQLS